MKLKELLMCGIAAGVLVGCSNTSKDQALPTNINESNAIEEELKIEQNSMIQYLFGNTAKASLLLPELEIVGGSDGLFGVLSQPIKDTIKSIWKNLKNRGFSGYDVGQLDAESVTWHASFNSAYVNIRSLVFQQTNTDFHSRFIEYLVHFNLNSLQKEYFPFSGDALLKMKYAINLFGLKYQNKILTVVKTADGKYEAVLANEFREGASNAGSFYVPDKIDSDEGVTQKQIDEWNQVFIDALKADPFFGKQMSTPADTSGSTSALNALKGKTGVDAAQLRVNGISGAQMDVGLPVYVQLKGDVDSSKTRDGVTGVVAYRFGNTAVGAIQSYANESETSHTETSLLAAQSLGNMYIEGQLGTVSFEGGSGMRSQARLGVDTPYGMPFVQLTHRDFGATSDTAAYVGLEVSAMEFKTADYTFSTQLIAKAGHHSVNGNVGVIEGSAKISFSHGLSVDTQLSFGSNTASKLSFNVAFEQ